MINDVVEEEIPQKWCERKENTTYVISVSLYRGEIDQIEMEQTQILEDKTEHTKRYIISRKYPTYDITLTVQDRVEYSNEGFSKEMKMEFNWFDGWSWFYYANLEEAIKRKGVIKTQKAILKKLNERIRKFLTPDMTAFP